MLPVAVTNPPVLMLAPVILPVDDVMPVTNNPVPAKTAMFDVPPTATATFELAITTTLLVPLTMLVVLVVIPDSREPLPT